MCALVKQEKHRANLKRLASTLEEKREKKRKTLHIMLDWIILEVKRNALISYLSLPSFTEEEIIPSQVLYEFPCLLNKK